jgi:DNA-binding transcriptional LysR family regulator
VAVADELNFTRAAERLHLSQQALSAQIRQLEERVGSRLVDRDTRRVELTAAGDALCEESRALLAAADNAVSAARAAGERSRLTAGVRAAATLRIARAALELFRERHPEVEMTLSFGGFIDPSAGLRGGDVDVGIIAGPFDTTGLELRPLFSSPRGAVRAADHPLAQRSDVSFAELLAEPSVDRPSVDPIFRDFWLANAHRGGIPPRFAATTTSMDGMLEAIRAGLAIEFTLEAVVRELGPGSGLTYIRVPELEPAEFRVGRRVGDERPQVLAFIETALAALRVLALTRLRTRPGRRRARRRARAACCVARRGRRARRSCPGARRRRSRARARR